MGRSAFDPKTGILYVNSNEMPWILNMVDISERGHTQRGQRIYNQYCATCHGLNREGNTQQNFPALTALPKRCRRQRRRRLVEEGKGFMPSFRFLPDSEKNKPLSGFSSEWCQSRTMRKWKLEFLTPTPATTVFCRSRRISCGQATVGDAQCDRLEFGIHSMDSATRRVSRTYQRGIPQTGTENYGGPVVTAGGLLFIAANEG
jgi:quinoprotein glucose dehydrogenase